MEVIFVVYTDGHIVELDLSNGQVLRQIQTLQGQYTITPSLATSVTRLGDPFNSSGAIFVQHKASTKASILNCAENHLVEVFTPAASFGGTGLVTCTHVSKCGNWLFRGLQTGSVLVTYLKPFTDSTNKTGTQQMTHRLISTNHMGAITSIATNFGWIATASEDQIINVTPLATFLQFEDEKHSTSKNILRLHGHTLPVTAMYLSEGCRLFSVSRDQTLKVWDVFTQSRLFNISFPSALTCLEVTPTENTAYVGSKDGKIYKINFASLKESDSDFGMNLEDKEDNEDAYCFIGHKESITSVKGSFDFTKVVSTSTDQSIIVWDESTCQKLSILTIHKAPIAWCQIYFRSSISNRKKRDHNEKTISSSTVDKSVLPVTFQHTNTELLPLWMNTSDSLLNGLLEPYWSTQLIHDVTEKVRTKKLKVMNDHDDTDLQAENQILKQKVEELTEINAKWKAINNQLYSASLNKALK